MVPYESLANAIVLQAVKDYRNAECQSDIDKLELFFRSGWFGVLTSINPEILISKLREEKGI